MLLEKMLNHRGCHTMRLVMSVIMKMYLLDIDLMVHCSSDSKEEEYIR